LESSEEVIPGLDFIAKGYNLFKADPHASGVNADPGFLLPVFNISACCQSSQVNGYDVPNDVNADAISSCNKEYIYTGITGVQHLSEELTKFVEYSASTPWTAFSESVTYQTVYKATSVNHDIFTLSTWDCSAYKISLNDPFDLPPIHENFIKMVQQMPTTYNPQNMDSFFYGVIDQDFGTHYVYEGNWGGITGSLDATTDSLYTSFSSSNLQINTSADCHMLSCSASKQSMTQQQIAEADAFASIIHTHFQFEIGGQPPANGDPNVWNKILQSSSVPLKISIKPLSDLLTTTYFPGDHNITAKQKAWTQAIAAYCTFYQQKNPKSDINCNGYPPDRSLPPQSIWKGVYVPPDSSSITGNNPYTSQPNCPKNFKQFVWIQNAQGGNIWYSYMCLNQTVMAGNKKDAANMFGGMWMTGKNQEGCTYGNPMNGGQCECVTGYDAVKSFTYCMADGQMISSFVCLKTGNNPSDSFLGGFYQTGYYKLTNVWSQGTNCPSGHTAYPVAENFVCNGKSSNDKCSLYVCLSNVYHV